MKAKIPFPDEKITWFKEKLGIKQNEFEQIDKYSHQFINNKYDFSKYIFNYFIHIDDTGFLLTHQEHGKYLIKIWGKWFESFFRSSFDNIFLASVWKSGLRHVEMNIDHRFITLSYSVLRQFCQDIVKREVPLKEQKSMVIIIDKMVDLCLLIETHAFVEGTSRCDMEVVRGISHQVRNPLTVIGGNVMRLMRSSDKDIDQKDIPEICNTIIQESKRLERMVIDAISYSDMYQKEVDYSVILVKSLVSNAIDKISDQRKSNSNIKIEIVPSDIMIQGDKEDLEMMFINIIQHCFDTSVQDRLDLRILAKHDDLSSPFIQIEILNKGSFHKPDEIQNAFVPFFSSKPDGTGFGLSIARLAARKSLGDIFLDTLPDEGIRYVIKLPVPFNQRV